MTVFRERTGPHAHGMAAALHNPWACGGTGSGTGNITGKALDIGADGRLKVQLEDGSVRELFQERSACATIN